MQRTRLNLLVNQTVSRIDIFFINPWRRIAFILISVLLGIFMGTAIPTTAGQTAAWDLVVASLLILFTETVSLLIYRSPRQKEKSSPSTLVFALNGFKIGLTFGLYLEAVKLAT